MPASPHLEAKVATPEVQELIRRLAEHGLAACLPHMHSGDVLVDLEEGLVQYEEDLRVSFVPGDSPQARSALPVAWRWDGDRVQVIGRCRQGHVIE